MRQIKCPVLVLWSKHNPGLKPHNAAEGLEFIPDGRMVVMENSSHWPQWEEQELFDDIHIKFLTGK